MVRLGSQTVQFPGHDLHFAAVPMSSPLQFNLFEQSARKKSLIRSPEHGNRRDWISSQLRRPRDESTSQASCPPRLLELGFQSRVLNSKGGLLFQNPIGHACLLARPVVRQAALPILELVETG